MNIQTEIRYGIMRELVGKSEDKTILDIGCGKNPISNGLKTKKTFLLDGVENNSPDICCNVREGIPLENDFVDVIIAGEIIEHIINVPKFIRECNRILKEGGFLIISTPNICSLKNRIRVLFGKLPEGCAFPSDDESFERHIVDFNFKSIKDILSKEGFEIDYIGSNGIISYGRLLFPLKLTPKLFGETLIIKAIKNLKWKEK